MLATLALTILIAAADAQAALTGVRVAGVVQDQTGAVLPTARVTLTPTGSTSIPDETVADAAGAFRFERVRPGTYDIRAEFPGFKARVARVRVRTQPPAPFTIVLQLEDVKDEVSVTTGGQVSAQAGANLNAIAVDERALDNLPILDQDVVGAVSRFLDSSAIGTGGVTLLVDGVEVSGLKVPPSVIQQVRINQDPYAAEFMRPGRGRIEIITKPGGRDYKGTLNLRFRDSSLNARNAFATSKPQEQRRTVEGTFGGPVPGTTKTSFLVSGSHTAEDGQAILFAQTLAGPVRGQVPSPSRDLLLTASWTHMQGEKHMQSVRFSHLREKDTNQGIGGTSLPDVASTHDNREDELIFSQQTILTPHLVNDVRLLVGDEREPRVSLRPDRRIVVVDAFTGGGAQSDSLRTEHHFTLLEAITWSTGRHTIKAGLNIPDWSWRGFDDRSNLAGTFSFSSLSDYALGRPFSFVQQSGDGHVRFLEKVVSGFVRDEVRLRPNLSIDLGLRYDWQNYFHDANNFAPRLSLAYAPNSARRTVLRGGAGIFYDRTGEVPIRDLIRYDGHHLARYVIVDPAYPDPLPGQTLTAQPSSIVQLAADSAIPATFQYSVGVERELRPKTTVSVNLIGSRGFDLFRSRDVNAPLAPAFLARPDSTRGVVRQIESVGRMRTASLQTTLRGALTQFFNGAIEYTYGRAKNDTSGISWMPPNAYDTSLEYARADFNQRHRLEMFGSISPGKKLNVGVSMSLGSGRPYSLTTGLDAFNTGQANARPAGVRRNSLTGPGFASLDVRWSREFEVSHGGQKWTVTPGLDAFNVLNRVNYSSLVGNLSSPFFGRAISAQAPRRLQISLRVR